MSTPPLRIQAQQRSLLHSSLERGSAISLSSYYRQRKHKSIEKRQNKTSNRRGVFSMAREHSLARN